MRVAIRGLLLAIATVILAALYVFLLAPRLIDPDNMAAPLLFVGVPLFFIHGIVLAIVCGSSVCAGRSLYAEESSRNVVGYTVFAISVIAGVVLAYPYIYHYVLGR